MEKHTCKQCGSIFEYCRGCLLSPILHMDAGFCSKECYEASKNMAILVVKPEPIVEEIATVEIEEAIVENNNEPTIEDAELVKEKVSVEVETEATVFVETPITETITVAEPTNKKETYNTYKKKKNKYR